MAWGTLGVVALDGAEPPSTAVHTVSASILHGSIGFVPDPKESTVVPEPFRLPAHTFPFELQSQSSVANDVEFIASDVSIPCSTAHTANNSVHCEYYRPAGPGRHPACIVLHILGGDFPLSRTFAFSLANRGVAALFVIMPYYGPRHDPNSSIRMISSDPRKTG